MATTQYLNESVSLLLGESLPVKSKSAYRKVGCCKRPSFRELRLSDLRHLRNSITLTQLPAASSPLTRDRLFHLRFKFL